MVKFEQKLSLSSLNKLTDCKFFRYFGVKLAGFLFGKNSNETINETKVDILDILNY